MMQQEPEVKREEDISKRKAINKKKSSIDEVKYQDENSSVNSDKKKRGRPKKNPYLSSQVGEHQFKHVQKRHKNTSFIHLKDTKIEQKQGQSKKKPELSKSKISQSNENDLCKALLLMKKTLPNKSLEKIIIQLYQSIVSQESLPNLTDYKIKQGENRSEKDSKKDFEYNSPEKAISQSSKLNYAVQNDQTSNFSKNSSFQQEESQMKGSIIEKLVVPGRKVSCYHDKAGQIAATSHQFYKKNLPSLQNLQNLQKNMNFNELTMKSFTSIAMDEQTLGETKHIQKGIRQNKIFSFKQSLMLRKVFFNPIQEQKYKQRRLLAKLFVERGYGITKAIDDELPPIDIDRNRYKNLLGGILTMAFRKLESFVANQCSLSIKYIDREQMKSLSGMLLNCRVKLQPVACETYFKFLRAVFALGDVLISQNQALDLYVDVSRHLYGKNITIGQLQNMGKVKNRRIVQTTIQGLKKKVQLQQQNAYLAKGDMNQSVISVRFTSQALNIQEKEQQIWTAALEAEFIHLYTKQQNLHIVQQIMGEKYAQLDNYMISQYQKKLRDLLSLGLAKMRKESVDQNNKLRLCDLQGNKQSLIYNSIEGVKVRCLILSYLMDTSKLALDLVISEINDFVDRKDLQDIINDIDIAFSQLGNESVSLLDREQNELIEFNTTAKERNSMLNENQNEHTIGHLFYE